LVGTWAGRTGTAFVNVHSRGGIPSGGNSSGGVAQPASNSRAAPKMNPENLNTRQFRETQKRTQADSISNFRITPANWRALNLPRANRVSPIANPRRKLF
jgi:hypothetical protein